jgi:hypothetical protein
MRFHHSLVISLVFSLTACGGGGGGPAGPSGATLDLVVDTAAGSSTLIAFVEFAALERPDGSVTGNLLDAPRDVVLVDPTGRPESLELRGAPAGPYTAVHLLVRGGGLRVRRDDGIETEVELESEDLRVPFGGQAGAIHDARELWQIHHSGPLTLLPGSGSPWLWRPELEIDNDRLLAFHEALLRVVAVNASEFTIDAVLQSFLGRMPVSVTVPASAQLFGTSGDVPLSRAGFFALLTPDDLLEVKGTMKGDGSITLERAKIEDDPRGEFETEVLARVLAIDTVQQELRVQVLALVRGTGIAGSGTLPELTVRASGAAIRFSGGGVTVPLTLEDLAAGDIVEVEWRGPVQNGTVTAHEIELEGDSFGPPGLELEGRVDGVDLSSGEITVVQRNDDPLLVAGQVVQSATVVIGTDTVLYLDSPDQRIALQQVQVGWRIQVRGVRVLAGTRVTGFTVRVRPE